MKADARHTQSTARVLFGGPDMAPGALAAALAERIEAVPAGGEILWSAYYFGDGNLARLLVEADRRGVRVVLNLEARPRERNDNRPTAHFIAENGNLRGGFRETASAMPGHLHEKIYFFSHPRPVALVGSYNPSVGGPVDDRFIASIGDQARGHNLLVEIAEPEIVAALRARVLEPPSFLAGRFAREGGEVVERAGWRLAFFPRRDGRVIEKELDHFRPHRVRIAASHIRDRAMVRALGRLTRAGVAVSIIAHDTQRRFPSRIEAACRKAGIEVRRYRHPERLPMHCKFILMENAGGARCLFGSANLTLTSRWLNREVLVSTDDPGVCAALDARWRTLEAEISSFSAVSPAGHRSGVSGRVGWVPLPPNRSIVCFVSDGEAARRLRPLLDGLLRTHERLTIFIVPARAECGDRALYPEPVRFIAAPWPWRPAALIFLLTTRARLVIATGAVGNIPASIRAQAHAMGIPAAVFAAGAPAGSTPAGAPPVDAWLSAGAEAGELAGLLARRPPLRRPLQSLVQRGLDHPWWSRLLGLRARRIATLDELRAALGKPDTILCLGNGPSSEHPALAAHAYDALFRVNHRWLERGLYCDAGLVFTGQKRTLFTVKNSMFAFQTRRAEAQLVTHQVFNPLCSRMRFVTLQNLNVLPGLDWDGIRPTNGATMLATAVALKPRRIVIAGIDLFADPAGSYPGDAATPNAYVPVHERSLERDFILEVLEKFDGELVIIGQALADLWNERKAVRG